uniref:VOC domain-containing protein n=1 Tax=Trieres chinensis TaxID=1514140 RepID=A0A7S2ELB3_TRICV
MDLCQHERMIATRVARPLIRLHPPRHRRPASVFQSIATPQYRRHSFGPLSNSAMSSTTSPPASTTIDSLGAPSRLSSNMRTLHWVTKIGSLRSSLRFYELVFGFRVLRHEEFETGCEATCNGPYGGAWSKTMVGLGDEKDNFVFELTYNYGIDSYRSGNDVVHFALAMPEAVPRAVALGYEVKYERGCPIVVGPDGYRYAIVDPAAGRAERFWGVCLRSSDLDKTREYWCGVLGMTEFPTPAGLADLGGGGRSLTVGWAPDQAHLRFVDPGDSVPVDHALASGRIANACRSVEPFHNAAVSTGLGGVLNPPVTLPTPGKADVVVTILTDPDGYEICFVGDEGFYDLAVPLYDKVDWDLRTRRGGDGAPAPGRKEATAGTKPGEGGIPTVTGVAETESLASSAPSGAADLEFGAMWCKNCT